MQYATATISGRRAQHKHIYCATRGTRVGRAELVTGSRRWRSKHPRCQLGSLGSQAPTPSSSWQAAAQSGEAVRRWGGPHLGVVMMAVGVGTCGAARSAAA